MRIFTVGFVCFLLNAAILRPVTAESWQHKIDPVLLDTTQRIPNGFLVEMVNQADVSAAAALSTKAEKGQYIYDELTALAERDQAALLNTLDLINVDYRAYWIANMVWVYSMSNDLAVALAERSDVAYIYTNPTFESTDPTPQTISPRQQPTGIEWNLTQINAPDVWQMGITGKGVVIGAQDTGYDWDHPGLQQQYRGWNGTTADHNFNWHDAAHGDHWLGAVGNPCGFDSAEPCDDGAHGTHTLGTMVGNDMDRNDPGWPAGANNAVGVAPGADWIACRNMENSWGSPASYSECFQWFVAPTDLNGEYADPAKAPHVVNNSWSCPESEGCSAANIMKTVVDNVRAAGIVVVVAAGNSGPNCDTVNTPAAIYDSSFTVGATDNQGQIANYSGRGHVAIDGSNRLKPDIVAPGSSVRSTTPTGYGSSSGTSMAGPHVAGLVALLIEAAPSLAGHVDVIEQIIRDTATPTLTDEACGGIPAGETPNATYGAGRINALAAVQSTLDSTHVNMTETGVNRGRTLYIPMVAMGIVTGIAVMRYSHASMIR